ncbi:hypothetical protein HK100_006993 [Physocladia obscura]|uniref:Heterokaryon incompatibility domain-containing protein n=1 Tax=Physocladia obscura TaxID=109957 RepID=A0AAD5SVJ3_9FUNG|nr:hypothetical protein HK100_006993 [Physocladia obscura]
MASMSKNSMNPSKPPKQPGSEDIERHGLRSSQKHGDHVLHSSISGPSNHGVEPRGDSGVLLLSDSPPTASAATIDPDTKRTVKPELENARNIIQALKISITSKLKLQNLFWRQSTTPMAAGLQIGSSSLNSNSKKEIESEDQPQTELAQAFESSWFNGRSTDLKGWMLVSHVWGTCQEGILNGVPVPVRSQSKLDSLRKIITGTVPVWLDLICVDQTNPKMKQSQVSVMDLVYSTGELTIVMLEHTDYTYLTEFCTMLDHFKDYETMSTEDCMQLDNARDTWLASEYMSRVWTFQELALSADIVFESVATSQQCKPLCTLMDTWYYCREHYKTESWIAQYALDSSAFLVPMRQGVVLDEIFSTIGSRVWSTYRRRTADIDNIFYPLVTDKHALVSMISSWFSSKTMSIPEDYTWYKHWYISKNLALSTRTCEHQHDLVYGVMGLLECYVVPDYDRPFGEVFAEFHHQLLQKGLATFCRATILSTSYTRRSEHACWSVPFIAQAKTLSDCYRSILASGPGTNGSDWNDYRTPKIPALIGKVGDLQGKWVHIYGATMVLKNCILSTISDEIPPVTRTISHGPRVSVSSVTSSILYDLPMRMFRLSSRENSRLKSFEVTLPSLHHTPNDGVYDIVMIHRSLMTILLRIGQKWHHIVSIPQDMRDMETQDTLSVDLVIGGIEDNVFI